MKTGEVGTSAKNNMLKDGCLHVLEVSPTGYSQGSVIGGGEKYVLYVDHALQRAAAEANFPLFSSILSLDAGATTILSDHEIKHEAIKGRAWDPFSLDANELIAFLERAHVVYVHQCLTHVGLYVAAHARLLGKRVVGMDSGAGEYQLLRTDSRIASIYDAFHAHSTFAEIGFHGFDVPTHVIPGPVDTDTYLPSSVERDPNMVLTIGRILPHKGFECIIDNLPSSLSLTIVGSPYDQEYHEFLRERVQGKNVSFLHGLGDADLRNLFAKAGLFVHASTHIDYRGRYYHKPELLGLAPLEALSTGLTTCVSAAGALSELAGLPGCHLFSNPTELANLLERYRRGALPLNSPKEMHDAVVEQYGPVQFGRKLLTVMGAYSACAS